MAVLLSNFGLINATYNYGYIPFYTSFQSPSIYPPFFQRFLYPFHTDVQN